jgi:hypothetical protein
MLIVGLLSSESEAQEIKNIAKMCQLRERIHFIVRMQKLKEIISEEDKLF